MSKQTWDGFGQPKPRGWPCIYRCKTKKEVGGKQENNGEIGEMENKMEIMRHYRKGEMRNGDRKQGKKIKNNERWRSLLDKISEGIEH